jgi:hypothetical protein
VPLSSTRQKPVWLTLASLFHAAAKSEINGFEIGHAPEHRKQTFRDHCWAAFNEQYRVSHAR